MDNYITNPDLWALLGEYLGPPYNAAPYTFTLTKEQLTRCMGISWARCLYQPFVCNQLTDTQFDECLKQIDTAQTFPHHVVNRMNPYQRAASYRRMVVTSCY